MIVYWLYKFEVEDRDVGIVDYVSIDESLDIPLPVASVCISLPFLKPRMLEQINLTTYYTFISGLGSYEEYDFEQNLAHVDYSSVTLKLGDYSALNETRLRNMSKYESIDDSVYYKESFNGFDAESFASAFGKCFEIKSTKPDYLVEETMILYDLSKMSNDLGVEMDELSMSVSIHYPGQLLLRTTLPMDINVGESFESFLVEINDIEVIKSRNSRNRRCTLYDEMRTFDDMVREKHIQTIECRPPYLRAFQNFSTCSPEESLSFEEIVEEQLRNNYDFKTVRNKYYPKSCQRLTKIAFEKTKLLHLKESFWELRIHYPENVRIITQSKEVDIHTLIGNIGGYIGLFLGTLDKSVMIS